MTLHETGVTELLRPASDDLAPDVDRLVSGGITRGRPARGARAACSRDAAPRGRGGLPRGRPPGRAAGGGRGLAPPAVLAAVGSRGPAVPPRGGAASARAPAGEPTNAESVVEPPLPAT